MAQIAALTANANPGFAIGQNGATNPVLSADCSVSSAATGVKVTGRAATAGVDIAAVSSGTNENLRVDAKGSGTIDLGTNSTGAINLKRDIAVTGKETVTSADAAALAIGPNGATNPSLQVDASTSSAATGLKIKSAAAAAGVDASVISSGSNENLTINAKGSGTIDLNPTGTGNVTTPRGVLSRGGTAGIGYATGAGGAVSQATSRTTGVTVNKVTGAITLVSAAGSATPFSFTVTNSAVAATDVIVLNQKSGTDKYDLKVTAVGAGSFEITANTTGGTTTEQPVINFAVIKGVAA